MPRSCRFAALLLLLTPLFTLPLAHGVVRAQEGVGIPVGDPREPIVHRKDISCAGFISKRKLNTNFKVIGGEMEDERISFNASDIVYLDYGARDGASVGDTLYVIRPRGEFENPFTGKDLGYYHEELGLVRIIAVQRKVSTAQVIQSCDSILFGDIVRPFDQYVAPEPRDYQPLNRYDLPSGKLSGQIVFARDQRSFLGANDIIFVDIGADQGVRVGQYYTVYREPGDVEGPVGPDDITYNDDIVDEDSYGFKDKRYKAGRHSIIEGKRTRDEVIEKRPGLPRKVVGEICIIRLEGKTATGVITRTTQEVNIGDYVELQ